MESLPLSAASVGLGIKRGGGGGAGGELLFTRGSFIFGEPGKCILSTNSQHKGW